MKSEILEALDYIRVSSLSYQDWLSVGLGLKAEGFSWRVWDEWSKNDSRYKDGECKQKWDTFNGSSNPITGATIIKLAKEYGYSKTKENMFLDWNDVIEYDGDDFEVNTSSSQCEQLKEYLKVLFKPNEYVGIITNDVFFDKKDGRWKPRRGYFDRTAKELTESLEKYPSDLGATIGDWKSDAGAWIRFNPLDGKGAKKENVTRFDYTLIECDDISCDEQIALYQRYRLPIACLVSSAGKSIHAIVKVNAKDKEEYEKRVNFLYSFLEKNGVVIDKANKDPNRMSRLPGATRNGKSQTLIATNIGESCWDNWMDYLEGEEDDLAELEYPCDLIDNRPELADELIEGLLRCGHKMIVSGASKAGKSFFLIELAIAISEGLEFLGFKCKKKNVLYVNLEIDRPSCFNRFFAIYDELKIKSPRKGGLSLWNLRGHAMPLDKLVPKLIRRVKNKEFSVIIIDPIYKVITGDENSASEMGYFCNQFDKICDITGCSVIYAHHHSKGAQGGKQAQDRSSGSGVFARDPDAIIDLVELEIDDELKTKVLDNPSDTAWQMEFVAREFKCPPFRKIWFSYPLHRLDDKDLLKNSFSRGDIRNAQKSSGNYSTRESRLETLDSAYDALNLDGNVSIKDLAEYCDLSEKTIRRYVKEFSESYSIKDSLVTKIQK